MELISALSVEAILEFQVVRRLISVKTTSKALDNAVRFVRRELKAGNFEMTTPDKEEMPTDRTAGLIATAIAYLREEADFNRSWADGRRKVDFGTGSDSEGYKAHRLELALVREAWADAIEHACNAYEPMRKALEKVMVGGNHLGLIIGADHPPHTANHEEARAHYGDAIWTYEVWCCWKTIMEARPALSTLPVIDRQTSDDVGRLREALVLADHALKPFEDAAEMFAWPIFETDQHAIAPGTRLSVGDLRRARAARAALKGVPQPASDDYQADAGAPALSEKVNVRSEWLPIESAPRDGTHILAFGPQPGCNAREHGWTEVRETHFEHSGWDWYEAVHNRSHKWKPTHWMPLPSPPGAEVTISNDAERDPVSLKPDTSSQPASEAGKLSKKGRR